MGGVGEAEGGFPVVSVMKVALGVVVVLGRLMLPPPRPATRPEASAGLMVLVEGVNVMVVAALPPFAELLGVAEVLVVLEVLELELVELLDVVELLLSGEVSESVPFEVVLDVSPPFAPVASIRDRAFASLVHEIIVPLLFIEGSAKHLLPLGQLWVCHVPFAH